MAGEWTRERLSRRRYLTLSNAAAGAALVGGSAVTGSVAAVTSDEPAADDEAHTATDVVIESHDGVEIAATVFRPAGATADDPVPMILHSHGWSGSRTTDVDAFEAELDRGFAVLSFDQRGHGDSGGDAHVQNPELEGRDVVRVLDYVTEREWIERSRDGNGRPTPDDPMVFAMGGSYGGAYQLVGAFVETAETGSTRFDALAPEITWFDLSESLAPQGVPRSVWALFLYVVGAPALADHVHSGFAYGFLTGNWPDEDATFATDLESRFRENGPSGFVEDGVRLDVPVLFGQGMTDNLFNLNEAWRNFERSLTNRARARSAVVGFNGGHALPNVYPRGTPFTLDIDVSPAPFQELRMEFFETVRDGTADARAVVDAPYVLETADGGEYVHCASLDDREPMAAGSVDLDVANVASGDDGFNAVGDLFHDDADELAAAVDAASTEAAGLLGDAGGILDGLFGDLLGSSGDGTTLPTGVGVPVHLELAEGELTVAGVPRVTATVSTTGPEQRLFAALSVGTSPADATVVQNNMLPLREPEPVDGVDREIELPGVAVDVAEDERLFLTLSAVSDMSIVHGSRVPGAVSLDEITVDVPVVTEDDGEEDDEWDDGEEDDERDDGEGDDERNDGEEDDERDDGEEDDDNDDRGDNGDRDDGDGGGDDHGGENDDGAESRDGTDDGMPGPGALGALGALGGVGYVLKRRHAGEDGPTDA